jgi:membrane protein YqaA with SNARE-associated domain
LRFLARLNQYLLIMGIPGLLAIAFLDSAAVPMPGGPDAVIMLLSWQRPEMIYLIVLAASLGSMLGCLVLYGIGRKGGEKALSRFNPDKVAWIEKKMHEYGALAVVAAVIAPPPFPTKPVILAAGMLRTGKLRFMLSVLAGRLIRYSFVAYLGAKFGDKAAQVLKAHYPVISLVLIGGILLIIIVRKVIHRNKTRGI